MAKPLDMDAILEQKAEATGSYDTFDFTMFDQLWTCVDPLLADDAFGDQLEDAEDSDEVAALYLGGQEQYEKFLAAGGRAGLIVYTVQQYQRRQLSADGGRRPTRRSTSSRNTRKKSKQAS